MKSYFGGKHILVTGGTGLIGIPLTGKLAELGAKVRVVSLDEVFPFEGDVEFIQGDLCDIDFCKTITKDIQIIFHLAGIKGGIGVAKTKAATFLIKNILMNTNIMEAARLSNVERFLYASSICIYPPAEVFKEENAETGLPHPSDRFGGMAKLIGEMQIEAYGLQYNLNNFLTARPVNTYGPHDNFNPVSALIIPALIYRIFEGENPLIVWGDGSAVRDFIYADDVADFFILMVERNAKGPFNVGSGNGYSIKELAEAIVRVNRAISGRDITIEWDTTKPAGEKYRIASMEKASRELDWHPPTDLEEGLYKTIKWYEQNKLNLLKRYDILSEV